MNIVIDIDEDDYKEICKKAMTIDEMQNTIQGRIYSAIVHEGMRNNKTYQSIMRDPKVTSFTLYNDRIEIDLINGETRMIGIDELIN